MAFIRFFGLSPTAFTDDRVQRNKNKILKAPGRDMCVSSSRCFYRFLVGGTGDWLYWSLRETRFNVYYGEKINRQFFFCFGNTTNDVVKSIKTYQNVPVESNRRSSMPANSALSLVFDILEDHGRSS